MSKRLDLIKKAYETKDVFTDRPGIVKPEFKVFRAKVGDNFISIIPPVKEDEMWAKQISVHYEVGVEEGVFICRAKLLGEPCPICEDRKKVSLRGNEEGNEELLDALRPTTRVVMIIWDTTSEDTKKLGVQIYDAPRQVYNQILGLCVDARTKEVIDIADVDKGSDVYFHRVGQTMTTTKYTGFKLYERKSIPDEILEDAPKTIEETLDICSYDAIEKAYLGKQVSVSIKEELKEEGRRERGTPKEEKVEEKVKDERTEKGEYEGDKKDELKRRLREKIGESRCERK